MALTTGNADAVATAFCSANGITDPQAIAKWKSFVEKLYTSAPGGLVNSIGAVLAAGTVVTVGSATTQTGPAAPVPITIS